MARIAGIDLPKGKRGVVGLTYIHGIGSKVLIFTRTKHGANRLAQKL